LKFFINKVAELSSRRLFLSKEQISAPLRSELFNADQMDLHGKDLARVHRLNPTDANNKLLKRLSDNERVIRETSKVLISTDKENLQNTPAEEWLLDNFYLIDEQIRIAKLHLPKKYSYGLPRLLKGPSANLPRVYDIALEAIAHSDAYLDPATLMQFVAAYQTISPLQLGELWALPIMLRLALIENLRRIAARLAISRSQQNLANFWANQMIVITEGNSTNLILVIADMARSNPPMEGSFVAEITRRLQGHGSALALPLSWIEQRLSQAGANIEQLVSTEIRQQAADQVSISNSINSLRILGTMNWREFVEQLSLVETTLRKDPSGFYGRMDFPTRDLYRHEVETLGKKSILSEEIIAQKILELAILGNDDDPTASHVGYYLIGKGRKILEKSISVRHSIPENLYRIFSRYPVKIYLGSIISLTALISYGLSVFIEESQISVGLQSLTIFLMILVTSQFSVSMINWLATIIVKPHHLPRLDLSKGIPDEARSLVIIPTMLTRLEKVEELCEALEVRYLANAMKNLHFALLTDLVDSSTEVNPQDALLIESASICIKKLNQRYPSEQSIFFLFHRPRLWNEQEKVWMGFERKRGKLASLNSLLRGQGTEAFSTVIGDVNILSSIKYVITLDTDTQLPRDAAWQCIGTIMHPLNKAHYDEKKQLVTKGYGILQPRVAASLPGINSSFYAWLSGGEPGIDPYTRMVSDVYQDALHEGSFIGKGIYDVDAFEHALSHRFPDNRILSHDLLEGCYARSGLISDVQLYEPYPSSYAADVSRRHRWVRGDWQIASWILPKVPGANQKSLKNPLTIFSRWKIFDNLRRSLVPLALTGILLLGWTVLTLPWLWTLIAIASILIPSLCASLLDLARKPRDITFEQHFFSFLSSIGKHVLQSVITLASLPYEAFYHADAILRTLWRMIISKRKLLQWTASSEDKSNNDVSIFSAFRTMWIAPVLAFSMIPFVPYEPLSIGLIMPILLLWALFPLIARRMSLPIIDSEVVLNDKQITFLRKISRKTWSFFETYVGPDDNWLPPDNVQENPVFVIAHRTSPTNMGLSLLANLTAWDFRYISTGELIERSKQALHTMNGMEKYEGHFYNWYDTQTLSPLNPRYISTVDSGNLAGHLLTFRQGLLEIIHQPIIDLRVFHGLRDTLNLLTDALDGKVPAEMKLFENILLSACVSVPKTLGEIEDSLICLADEALAFSKTVKDSGSTNWWAVALAKQTINARDELRTLLSSSTKEFQHIPTLLELSEHSDSKFRRLACERVILLNALAQQCDHMSQMSYDFLYDKASHLLAIGYNVSDHRRDTGFYDLLASEARLTNFIAIAQGKIPQESWFALGRKLTRVAGKPALLSWSGSMFEYLMPLLVMPPCENTLLDLTCKTAVKRQIEYGMQLNIPWGISESGYHLFDAQLNYQYRAFGVPGLGLKRGLADDLVIAPYATVMALMVAPIEALQNLQRLSVEGFEGKFGYYEAIDYTAARLPRGKSHVVIESFMVHHQGMSFLALDYLLHDKPMQRRFQSEPIFQATMLLLHEKAPKSVVFHLNEPERAIHRNVGEPAKSVFRFSTKPNTPIPQVQLLSNGRYHAMVTNAGGGSSRWKGLAVTRWRPDVTRDNWGTFCYIRDVASDSFWSTAFHPTLKEAKLYESILSEGRVEFRRIDNDIETHTEIIISPEDDIELRRSRITNRSRTRRVIEVTSYAEVVLAPAAADMAHPAFSNLFVQTEILEHRYAILCTRRARSEADQPPWMCHLMAIHGVETDSLSFETDRLKFIGRGNSTISPQAVKDGGALSDSQGSVLDPIIAIRRRIILEPQQTAIVDVVTGASENREACLALVDKYQDVNLANRVFELSWSHSQVILRQLNANEEDARLYNRLASAIYFTNTALRADTSTIIKNKRGQSGLWSYSISGDFPIVLLQIKNTDNIELVRQMVKAHAYWRLKGVAVDLVIWNEDQGGYRQVLQDQIVGLVSAGIEAHIVDRPGGIFIRPGDQIAAEDRILLESVACAIIRDSDGSLEDQIDRLDAKTVRLPRLQPTQAIRTAWPLAEQKLKLPDLVLSNGLGGFTTDGREYLIVTKPGQITPAPWSNVIANPNFGTVISESGQSYSWSDNAHEYRLTPWHNDPVTDAGGEAFYLRDEETGKFWSPCPGPTYSVGEYITRHGFGYSVFEHLRNGIHTELLVYVAVDAPIKFSVLKIRNESGRTRKISATGYVEWVLGDMRSKTGMHITTEIDKNTGAVFARNAYNTEFAERIAFFDVNDPSRSFTCDRREFIGRNGSLSHPTAMDRVRLSGKIGAALDSCAALQSSFELADGETREVIFKLGVAGRRSDEASSFVWRFYGRGPARLAFEAVNHQWRNTLGAVQVKTPDPALNVLANGWLMYQTIACRLWARSGYYQSGGAFGFRDQLQDAMAVIHTRPELLRAQLILCAEHQFTEGDVQHWWHPPSNRGVRTKCSDDYLWLPLATYRYVISTGDTGVLQEVSHFLEGRLLGPDEDSYYDLSGRSAERATLYEHCVRAIRYGLRFGEHGLPLIGSCDWNDGMDKVGEHGKGESVWLGFFLYDILIKFATISRQQTDNEFADFCADQAHNIQNCIEANAWDGEWYRRAYFDDGTPLGSASNEECQIDSLSQSWAILSGAGNPERSKMAMEAVNDRLVRRDAGLIQLLDPPFDKSQKNPGYIRGYVPGVRENGGQYTHAAIWTAMAFAKMGNGERAYELLNMINPINHSRTPEETALYKVEPYVVAADVYGVAPHTGRGGWTWYTGSSGWMYRLILESLLGLKLEANKLYIDPCLPLDWEFFSVEYIYRSTKYEITIVMEKNEGTEAGTIINIDGEKQPESFIPLNDDEKTHIVKVIFFRN